MKRNIEKALELLEERKQSIEKIIKSEPEKKDIISKTAGFLENLKLKGLEVNGKPLHILAGSLYIASIYCEHHITQREMHLVFGITEPTLRKYYRMIAQQLELTFPFPIDNLRFVWCRNKRFS